MPQAAAVVVDIKTVRSSPLSSLVYQALISQIHHIKFWWCSTLPLMEDSVHYSDFVKISYDDTSSL